MWSGASNPWSGGAGASGSAASASNPFSRAVSPATGCDCVTAYLNTGNHFGECTAGDPVVACTTDGPGYCQCAYYCPNTGESGRYLFRPSDVDCPEAPPGFGELPPGAESPPLRAGVPTFAGVPVCPGTVSNETRSTIIAFGDFTGSSAQVPIAILAGKSSPAGVDVDFVVGSDGRMWKVGPNEAIVKRDGVIEWVVGEKCQWLWRSFQGGRSGKCDGMCEAPLGGKCQSDC